MYFFLVEILISENPNVAMSVFPLLSNPTFIIQILGADKPPSLNKALLQVA